MRPERWGPYAALLALGLLSLALRPALPDDETRYLSVAWDMHRSSTWLVPTLEGEAYSHKPPLLFWLIRTGWLLLGPVEWWPRLLPILFGCGVVALGALLAGRLWGEDVPLLPGGEGARRADEGPPSPESAPLIRRCAPPSPSGRREIEARARWFILGSAGFALFTTVLLFDVMIACWMLLGLHGLVLARDGARLRGFALYALALALGGLTKGPVILVYLAPAALLAPAWAGPQSWRAWYLGWVAALMAALGFCLAWALPAATAGGPAYADAILWGQTAGRMVEAFAHRRPFWWYLPVLPVLLLPWVVWPLWTVRWSRPDAGERLCLLVAGSGFVIFSLISGKQAHYMVPLLPPLALVLARRIDSPRLVPVALGTLCLIAAALVAGRFTLLPRYDLRPAALAVAQAAAEGRPIGYVGRYQGEVSWLARLDRPVASLDAATTVSWATTHPDGVLIVVHRRGAGNAVSAPALHRQRYRGRELSLWPAGAAVELVERLR